MTVLLRLVIRLLPQLRTAGGMCGACATEASLCVFASYLQ